MSQFRGGAIEKRGSRESYASPRRRPNTDYAHALAGNSNAPRLETLRITDQDPAVLGLPAWSSANEPRDPRTAALEEQERSLFTKLKESGYLTRHGRSPLEVVEAFARDNGLWPEFDRETREKDITKAVAKPGPPFPPGPELRRRVTVDSPANAPPTKSSRGFQYEPQRMQWTKGGPYQTPRIDEHPQNREVGHDAKIIVPGTSELSSSPTRYDSETSGVPGRHDNRNPYESWNKSFRESTGRETLVKKANEPRWNNPLDVRAPIVFEPIHTDIDDESPGSAEPTGPSLEATSPIVFEQVDTDTDDEPPGPLETTGSDLERSGAGKKTDELPTELETENAALPTIPALPSQEDSFGSIADSFGTLLEATANPFSETDGWFAKLEKRTQPLLRELRRAHMKSRVTIAILDTGIDLRHDTFKDQFPNGRIKKVEDFVQVGGTGADIHGHGTHCAALLRRVAPEADIYVARVAVGRGNKSELRPANVVKALNRACRSGKDEDGTENWDVDIVSMSLGFYREYANLSQAVRDAFARNKIMVAAVSNDGDTGPCMWPASLTGVFAIHPARGYGETSATAPLPIVGNDFSILGENVESAWVCGTDEDGKPANTARTERRSGASVATPIAAGVIALVLELAMQGDPGNQDSHATFAGMLPKLKSFDGIREILWSMSRRRDHLNLNIVPWVLLDANLDANPDLEKRASRTHLGIIMKFILKQRFG